VVAPVSGVQVLVTQEFEEAAVPLVGAAPGGHRNHRASREAISSAEVGGDQAEFLYSIGVRRGRVGAQIGVHVGDAVKHVVGAAGPTSLRGSIWQPRWPVNPGGKMPNMHWIALSKSTPITLRLAVWVKPSQHILTLEHVDS
jgi:hypothetical protein